MEERKARKKEANKRYRERIKETEKQSESCDGESVRESLRAHEEPEEVIDMDSNEVKIDKTVLKELLRVYHENAHRTPVEKTVEQTPPQQPQA
ncbi:MAG: hypothetical protein Q8J97_05570, partial [Flavobacteriaceae bacterium]|nr:hypothetical protein [Flavobacteriaceae bacterium]